MGHQILSNRKLMEYRLANLIETLRRGLPNWVRRILPKWFKNLAQDIQWYFYKQNSGFLNGQLRSLSKPILLITIPKSGTHLLRSFLLLLPGSRWRGILPDIVQLPNRVDRLEMCKRYLRNARRGHLYAAHVPYDSELSAWLDRQGINKIFVYRDPRDYAVSLYHFIMNTKPQLPLYQAFAALGTDSLRLMACISGIGEGKNSTQLSAASLPNVVLNYQQFLGWLEDRSTFSVRFEDLIGDCPNSPSSSAPQTIQSMLKYLGVLKEPLPHSSLWQFINSAMDPSKCPTFRVGKTGTWREEFMPEHIEAFAIGGDLLIRLGYERDLKWGIAGKPDALQRVTNQ